MTHLVGLTHALILAACAGPSGQSCNSIRIRGQRAQLVLRFAPTRGPVIDKTSNESLFEGEIRPTWVNFQKL